MKLGAFWAGSSNEMPPVQLDAALIFAPAGELFPVALQAVRKGGAVISAGIHMSDIPSFPYSLLYGEKSMSSVTNLTREDGREFFDIVAKAKIETVVEEYALEDANLALESIRTGKLIGSAVLKVQ
jgi:propanol-preferring alcohol dehydrogenase